MVGLSVFCGVFVDAIVGQRACHIKTSFSSTSHVLRARSAFGHGCTSSRAKLRVVLRVSQGLRGQVLSVLGHCALCVLWSQVFWAF